ncbi:MAG: ASKHA domain-containing protein [Candidatus Hermodarchaeota archaeon]
MMSDNSKIIIDFEPISRRLYYKKNNSIYQLLVNSGIRIRSLCGGLGTCGKCKLLIQQGNRYINPLTDSEMSLLTKEEISENRRLACQCYISRDQINFRKKHPEPQIRVFLPQEMLIEDFKILTSGLNKGINLNPNVKKVFIEVNKPNLEDSTPDLERIISALKSKTEIYKDHLDPLIEFDTLKKIPLVLRKDNHRVTLTLYEENVIIDCEAGDEVENNYGIAFDIGTTTLVGYLINLNNGKTYSTASALNPQTAYGEDVVSRITFIKNNREGLLKLNTAVINALNEIIDETCTDAKISPSQIYEATFVGNSVMHHIFLNIDPSYIGLSPYVPAFRKDLNVKAKDINLKINRGGYAYILPLVAGFVGADTIGVILSSQIDKESDLTLAIDVGTNGEIVVGNTNILATGSCAAGSALEGAHIKNGMRAASGAIDTIEIDPTNLKVRYTTINNKEPIGICGSGIIDAVAEMLKSKIITRSGSFNKELIDHKNIIKNDKNIEFILVEKNLTPINRNITITQNDIRELQMAKAAFYSGTRIILNYLNQAYKLKLKIKQIYLAGAFGNYINKSNAKFIGMIPDISDELIYQIGNAAGIGAQNCLLNINLRAKARKLTENIKYVEIAIKQEFQKEYAQAMYFPHLNLEYFPSLTEYNDIPKR